MLRTNATGHRLANNELRGYVDQVIRELFDRGVHDKAISAGFDVFAGIPLSSEQIRYRRRKLGLKGVKRGASW